MTQIEKIIAEIERLYCEEAEKYDTSQEIGAKRILDELSKYINTLPTEQPSEKLEEAFDEVLPNPNWYISDDGEDAYNIKQMQEMFYAGADWQKEQTIKKACEWLNKNVVEYHPRKGELRPIVNINAFREAMGKEDEPNRVNIEPPSFEESQGEFNSYNVALNG